MVLEIPRQDQILQKTTVQKYTLTSKSNLLFNKLLHAISRKRSIYTKCALFFKYWTKTKRHAKRRNSWWYIMVIRARRKTLSAKAAGKRTSPNFPRSPAFQTAFQTR